MAAERIGATLAATAAIAVGAGTETSNVYANDSVSDQNRITMNEAGRTDMSGNPDAQLLMSRMAVMEGAGSVPTPTTTTTFKFRTETSFAGAQDEDIANVGANVLVNVKPKPMPRKWVQKQKAAGNCHMVGKGTDTPVVYTQGYFLEGGANRKKEGYGVDTRKSLVCNGIRVACGNKVYEVQPPRKKVIANPQFVRNWNTKAEATVSSKAIAYCLTSDGQAGAYAEATGYAKGKVSLRGAIKSKGHNTLNIAESAKLDARTTAVAKVFCSSSSLVILVEGKQPEIIPPKDSTQGPGAGTPGNTSTGSTVGGPGAGGQPGNEVASVPCYDPANTTGGDQIATTSGRTMYVWNENQRDQLRYCLVKAEEAAGTSTTTTSTQTTVA